MGRRLADEGLALLLALAASGVRGRGSILPPPPRPPARGEDTFFFFFFSFKWTRTIP